MIVMAKYAHSPKMEKKYLDFPVFMQILEKDQLIKIKQPILFSIDHIKDRNKTGIEAVIEMYHDIFLLLL